MNALTNKCPKCNGGEIYRSFLTMNKACPQCGHVFEEEEGYFTGALFLDCMILPISAIPTILIFALSDRILLGAAVALAQIVIISPFVFRYSRILWIRVGHHLDSSTK